MLCVEDHAHTLLNERLTCTTHASRYEAERQKREAERAKQRADREAAFKKNMAAGSDDDSDDDDDDVSVRLRRAFVPWRTAPCQILRRVMLMYVPTPEG